MTNREIFWRFIKNDNITNEDYLRAKNYYLEEATEEEKRQYDSYLEILVANLQRCYLKSEAHLKIMARKHGLTLNEALNLIDNLESNNVRAYLNSLRNKGVNLEEYLENLYVIARDCGYQKSKIECLVIKLNLSYEMFLNLIEIYMLEYLKLSKKEIKNILNKIEVSEDFYNFIYFKQVNNFENIWSYYKKFASEKEKELFNKIMLDLALDVYQDNLTILVMANNMENMYNIPNEYARLFIKQVVNVKKKSEFKKDNSKYFYLCEMFLNDVSFEEISDYIKEQEISLEYLRKKYLTEFVDSYKVENVRNSVYEKIILRIKEYLLTKRKERSRLRDKLIKEPLNEREFWEAKRVVTNLVYRDEGVKTLIKQLGEETFYRYITLVQIYDKELYNLYYARRNRGTFEIDNNVITNLVSYITNGILENNVLREFSILDYFRIVRIPINSLIKLLQDYDVSIRRVIVPFLLRNKGKLSLMSDNVLSDLNVSAEEDSMVRNYLILNNIPIFKETYRLALEEYRNGILKVEGNSRN